MINRDIVVFLIILFVFLIICQKNRKEQLLDLGFGGVTRKNLNSTLNQMSEQIFTDIKEASAEADASSVQISGQEIVVRGSAVGCDISQIANLSSVVEASSEVVASAIQKVGATFNPDITQAIVDDIEEINGWGAISDLVPSMKAGGKEEITKNIETNVTNVVKNTFEDKTWAESSASAVQIVDNKLIIDGSCSGSTFKQGADLQAAVSAATAIEKFNEQLSQNDFLGKVETALKDKKRKETQGAGGAIGEVGKGIGSVLSGATMPIMISAAVSCVILIVILLIALSPAGQNKVASMPLPPGYR